jgi:hypothetical protein
MWTPTPCLFFGGRVIPGPGFLVLNRPKPSFRRSLPQGLDRGRGKGFPSSPSLLHGHISPL